MNRDYWERVNRNYESEVLSVWDREQGGCVEQLLQVALESIPEPRRAADLGCGVGKFLPLLTAHFDQVEACDYTEEGLVRSAQLCRRLGLYRVGMHRADLTEDPMPFEPVDLVLCVNVLMMACFDQRMRAWRAVCNQVDHGGWIVLVVPSLESVLLEQHLERDALLQSGASCEESLRHTLPEQSEILDLHQGVHRLDGCPTKHYLKGELQEMLSSHDLESVQWERLHYSDADPEHNTVWDWCVLARRVANPSESPPVANCTA